MEDEDAFSLPLPLAFVSILTGLVSEMKSRQGQRKRQDKDVSRDLLLTDPVDLGGHDEVTLGESVDFVGPEGELYLSPGQVDVGMVIFFFCQRSHLVGEIEGGLEVGELDQLSKVVVVCYRPPFQLVQKGFDFFSCQGRNPTSAGNTSFLSQLRHWTNPISNKSYLANAELD